MILSGRLQQVQEICWESYDSDGNGIVDNAEKSKRFYGGEQMFLQMQNSLIRGNHRSGDKHRYGFNIADDNCEEGDVYFKQGFNINKQRNFGTHKERCGAW